MCYLFFGFLLRQIAARLQGRADLKFSLETEAEQYER